ncbi:hypothetical protein ABNB59_01825 [Paenibacillus larvae]|uniref:Uncharacterized protein n=3 Tax=Paenibacillus larvae TaxID=1464 RepID=V9WCW2_9BACL|nr:hypothetical protein [Paenibacillus larvae]AHD07689.1 hypothetical protein ERIC2_c40251 [Paenibacillus larvae subsp. larvae DSM 25430]AVF24116.1 hypothetical protein ERICI_04441 [Paenibacillus larvae subsp. larvae]AVF28628.1 hypothetical protein ERICIII_04617 [Paenibacillus larvae subsp. larvae]AVF33133.1 hypothetical protein ERICIV_04362 [Paenibacillus larvae subsp. larvae]AVG14248.1 hypothetical protein ERICII_04017 [Paenibacillus larvae subsp. larvae DSM 25430]
MLQNVQKIAPIQQQYGLSSTQMNMEQPLSDPGAMPFKLCKQVHEQAF